MRKQLWTAGIAVTALAGLQLAVASSASAATGVGRVGATLQVVAAGGVANVITVTQGATVVVADSADTVLPGAGCQAVTPNSVTCQLAGIKRISIMAGDAADTVNLTTSVAAFIDGGPDEDSLMGGAGEDRILGGAGTDALDGGVGDDWLEGGADSDSINGGPNDDWVIQEALIDGNDSISGGTGKDGVSYAARPLPLSLSLDGVNNDGAPGEADNIAADVEVVAGGRSDDVIKGSASSNVLYGNGGADALYGLDDVIGDDLYGGEGIDKLSGGRGSDGLYGGPGDDVLLGGPDNDGAHADPAIDGSDDYWGGSGDDSVHYIGRSIRVEVRLDGMANDGQAGEYDNNRSDVEHVSGGSGDDLIVGNSVHNVLFGGGGNDTIHGDGEYDILNGGPGNDELRGGDGPDWVDVIDGIRGNDGAAGDGGFDTCDSDIGDTEISCEA